METKLKKTLLHEWHKQNGATMGGFAEYDMPLWYQSGVKQEHLAVLSKAGIFDTSHMAVIMVNGKGSFDLLQHCFSRDLCKSGNGGPIDPGRCLYGVFLNHKGHVIDDAVVYRLDFETFMVVVNAGMGNLITHHLKANQNEHQVDITDLTDKICKLDVQGPSAARILSNILADPATVFDKMPYFSFKGNYENGSSKKGSVCLKDRTQVMISRTGYTGEFGFELFVLPEHFLKVWETIIKSGEAFGLIPCGIAARDSLRGGAMLPLSHKDIGDWPFINNPWLFALPYNPDRTAFTKTFIGDQGLNSGHKSEYTYMFAGFDPRKVETCNPAVVRNTKGEHLGTVLSCVTDMGIGRDDNGKIYSIASPDKPAHFTPKGLCCGFIKVSERLKYGEIVEISDRRRKINVMITDNIRPDRTNRLPLRKMV
ncbi:MAG: aminomethyltransferase family protein [Pseudomonadota bacterium]